MKYNQLTTEKFIERSISIHGDKYNYSLIEYKNNKAKVKIICPEHGIFEQQAGSHINSKCGCPRCIGKFRTTESFIKESIAIHNNKYDYSLVNYINNITKVKIICKEHGIFEQKPNTHLCKAGCPKCVGKNKSTEDFISESKLIHGELFDYSKTDYIGAKTKTIIICRIHGEFEQTPTNHLKGQGCPICKESIGEKTIRKHLKTHNIEYIQNKRFENCKDKYVLSFDFFIPSHNICIEFDGRQHFEVVKHFGGIDSLNLQIEHDNIKNKYCYDNNIELHRIRYDQDIISSLNFIFKV